MNTEKMAILKMVSLGKITVQEAESLLQALKETRTQLHQLNVRDVLKSFAESTKVHLETVKGDSLKNLKRWMREQKRLLKRNFRATVRECKQLLHR